MRSTRTSTSRPRMHLPTRMVRTVVVCLPAQIAVPDLPQQATAVLTARGISADGVMPHFATGTRRATKLVDRWQGRTSGGPKRLLDLHRMRANATAAAAAQWRLWQQVVDGTKPANPFWWFVDKHTADPTATRSSGHSRITWRSRASSR